MRIYIIGNDGITLCREAPDTMNKGETELGPNTAAGDGGGGGSGGGM